MKWQVLQAIHSFHSPAATATHCFDKDRDTDLLRERHGRVGGLHGTSRHDGHVSSLCFGAGAQFVTHGLNLRRRWTDERNTVLFAQPRKRCALG